MIVNHNLLYGHASAACLTLAILDVTQSCFASRGGSKPACRQNDKRPGRAARQFADALAFTDVALGREQEGIEEGLRAMETRPISEDAADGPLVAAYVAAVDAWANESSLAFEQLSLKQPPSAQLAASPHKKTLRSLSSAELSSKIQLVGAA